MRKKVIIFGLAANPIHLGHTAIAKELTKHCDEVWLSPCYSHMHNKDMASPADRLKMCQLAVNEIENVKACPIEIEQRWDRSTYELLCQLQEIFDDTDFSFCIGQDNADAIEKWMFHEQLISEFPFIVIPRINTPQMSNPQYEKMTLEQKRVMESLRDRTIELPPWPGERWYDQEPHVFLKDFKTYNVSSTLIRKSPKIMQDALHPAVYRYIKKHQLYEIHN